ncbi:MAG TPA: archaeosortase/exosortase family protein, partial [Chthonomonadales bacterium]|nr:archaeosortase/exosortase family protein [Chthonomonadales bacterium]
MFAALAMLALFSAPLNTLLRLSLSDDRYTHIVVIPLISLCLVYGKRKRIFADKSWCPSLGLPLLLLGWVLYVASNSHSLSLEAFAIVVTCMAGFILCYGIRPFK